MSHLKGKKHKECLLANGVAEEQVPAMGWKRRGKGVWFIIISALKAEV